MATAYSHPGQTPGGELATRVTLPYGGVPASKLVAVIDAGTVRGVGDCNSWAGCAHAD